MTETEQPIFSAPGVTILPKLIDEAAEILASYIESQEFWMIIADGYGFPLTEQITRRYYWDAAELEDFFACITRYKNVMLGVFVLRRRLMTADKYRFELQKQGINMSARELVEGGALIRVATHNHQLAREFARTFLDVELRSDGLAVEA